LRDQVYKSYITQTYKSRKLCCRT